MKSEKSYARGGFATLSIIILLAACAGGIGWYRLSTEHEEARSLPLNRVDFSRLQDGNWRGTYDGGMYQWRQNECMVAVRQGKVAKIELTKSEDPGGENTDHKELYQRVVAAQSLQVDTLSGATLTSKAYLQCVENALAVGQRNEDLPEM